MSWNAITCHGSGVWSESGLIVTRFLSRGDCLGTPGMWSTGQARGGAMRRNQSGSETTDSRTFHFRFRTPCQHLLLSLRLASDYDMKGCHRFSSHVKPNDSWHVINALKNILDTEHITWPENMISGMVGLCSEQSNTDTTTIILQFSRG